MSYHVIDQLPTRLKYIASQLSVNQIDAIAARGGPLKPLSGGVFEISQAMLLEYRQATYANHASNLGALIAHELAEKWSVPAYIVDPVTLDDFTDKARISGVPGIERKSRCHALNIKYCYFKTCNENDIPADSGRFIVGHFGSGFSIASVVGGKIIDVNDALLGMGPFSIDRAGALPLAGILSLIYEKKLTKPDLEKLLSTESGLKAYLGTNNFRDIETRYNRGENIVEQIVDGMIYQISKEIGSCFAVLNGNCDGLIITGGLANSSLFIESLTSAVAFIKNIYVYPGSYESEALASGVLRVLLGKEQAKVYQ